MIFFKILVIKYELYATAFTNKALQRIPILNPIRSKHTINRYIWAPISTNISELTRISGFQVAVGASTTSTPSSLLFMRKFMQPLVPKTWLSKDYINHIIEYSWWDAKQLLRKQSMKPLFKKKMYKEWKSVLKPTWYLFCSSWASQGNMATSPSVTVMFLCKSVATDLETEKKSFSYFFEKDFH